MPFPRLFERGRINRLELKNRLIMAPMDKNYADPLGCVTQRYVDYLEGRARGGVGLILMEATYVDPVGRNRLAQLGLHSDDVIASFRPAVDVVHAHGCKLGTQIHFAGRQATSWATGRRPVAPSAVPCPVFPSGDVPRPLAIPEIAALVEKFAAAARRAKDAGLDLVEIHGAHGYVVNQFLSGHSNRRNDEYGGSLENRMRFPLEVVRAVRRVVGPDYPIAYRLSVAEFVEGGLATEETTVFATRLEQEGIDLLDASAGIYESRTWMVQPSSQPPGCLVELIQPVRQAVRIPVSVAGRINEPGLAESILREGKADFITMGRALHADPDFPGKARADDVDAINRCPACMACVDQLGADLPISCMVNPAAGRERQMRIRPAERARRVIVVGGGPAGLSAARVLALRGHRVTLLERDAELGGALRIAARAPHKSELDGVASYFAEQLRRLQVDVRLGETATVESVLAERPDAVVVATGAIPLVPFTPGIQGNPRVVTAHQVLGGQVQVGGKVLVMGAGMAGSETALVLANQGADVVVVEPTDTAPRGIGARSGAVLREEFKNHPRISSRTRTTVEEIDGAHARLYSQGEEGLVGPFDSIVVAVGTMSDIDLADRLVRAAPELELHVVGDCALPRLATDAVYEGFVAGLRI